MNDHKIYVAPYSEPQDCDHQGTNDTPGAVCSACCPCEECSDIRLQQSRPELEPPVRLALLAAISVLERNNMLNVATVIKDFMEGAANA